MALKVARRAAVAPFHAVEVLRAANARAQQGQHVLHLEVGEPAAGAPPAVLAAARRTLDQRHIGYTEPLGIPPLRARIARHYQDRYSVAVDPAQVALTVGASGAFLLAFLAAFEPGDRVALAEPGYPAYRNILGALGIEAVALRAGPEHRFQPTPEMLAAAAPLDGVIIASPSNPTGTMLEPQAVAALAAWCADHDTRLVSDEIYHGITYGMAETCALPHDPNAIVINSFSKYFAMTGWRLGWMLMPADLAPAIDRLAQNLVIAPPALPQYAALEAFNWQGTLDAYVAGYARNRRLLLNRLPEAGFELPAPADGAFYIYAGIGGLAEHSQTLCADLLRDTGVAATPGIDFDRRRGHRYIRFSFAGAEADMAEAADRLAAWGRDRAPAR